MRMSSLKKSRKAAAVGSQSGKEQASPRHEGFTERQVLPICFAIAWPLSIIYESPGPFAWTTVKILR